MTTADPVTAVLDGLDATDRQVVELRYGARQSVTTLASSLLTSPDEVARRLMRIYRQVAAALED